MQSNLRDSTTEPTLGGVVLMRRRLMGNSLGANITNSEGRIFTLSFRLEPGLVRTLSVSYRGHFLRFLIYF